MGHGLEGKVPVSIDVARTVVGKGLGPAPSFVVADGAVECAVGMKLVVEQPDATFDATAARVQPVTQRRRTWLLGVGPLFRMHANPVLL